MRRIPILARISGERGLPGRCRDPWRLVRYFELVGEIPDLFANTGGADGITILIAPEEIAEVEQVMAGRLASAGQPVEWAAIGVLNEDQYTLLLRDAVRFGDGRLGTYFRVIPKPIWINGVTIVPIVGRRALLIRQYRHATRQWHLEVPRGNVDAGEARIDAARRELAEEIGAEAGRLVDLGMVHTTNGLSSECLQIFAAEIGTHGAGNVGESIIDIRSYGASDIDHMLASGEITCGITIAALSRARLRGLL